MFCKLFPLFMYASYLLAQGLCQYGANILFQSLHFYCLINVFHFYLSGFECILMPASILHKPPFRCWQCPLFGRLINASYFPPDSCFRVYAYLESCKVLFLVSVFLPPDKTLRTFILADISAQNDKITAL